MVALGGREMVELGAMAEVQNIYEVLIRDWLRECRGESAPRVEVRRQSLEPFQFSETWCNAARRTEWPLERVAVTLPLGEDFSRHFVPEERSNRVWRSVMEVDLSRYSNLKRGNPRVLFSFSGIVHLDGMVYFYYQQWQDALAAMGLVCRFEGTFEAPTGYETHLLWQS